MDDGQQIQENLAADLAKGTPEIPNQAPSKNGKRNRVIRYILLFFAFLAIIAFILWWEIFRNHESTDDAYVGGNMVIVNSRVEGSVNAFYADDTDFVEQGRLLVELDPTDYLLNFEQSKVALELAARQVRTLFEEVKQRESDVKLKQAVKSRSLTDFNNRAALVGSEAVSREDYTHSSVDLNVAEASLQLSMHELEGAKAKLGSGPLPNHPLIEKAKNDVRDAYLSLTRCNIYAPVSGFIAKRSVQAGQSLRPATPLLAIIPLEDVWVDANFKETQLEDIRIGQPVELTADMYGRDVYFHGSVVGFLPGSGSVFSLLPPQNASGNWIKIVQRVPVRISLDREQVKKYPLFLGLSVYVKVTTEDTSGPVLAEQRPLQKIMQTDVFDVPFDSLEPMMQAIVESNLQLLTEP